MLAGHYASALIAKRFAPNRSLGVGFVGAQLEDILWAGAILLGIEHARIVPHFLPASPFDLYDFPWTHGLLLAIIWAALFGLLTRSVVFGLCAFSHWILDFIAHWHDLPVLRHPELGLGLWKHQTATFLTEAALLIFGLILYMRATKPTTPAGRFAIPVFIAVIIAFGAYNIYGPPPHSMTTVGIMAEASYVGLALVATWLDRKRAPANAISSASMIASANRASAQRV